MASHQDLDLAKRLLSARVLTQDQLRAALAMQSELREEGREVGLEPVLYHKGLLPKGSLEILRAPSPLQTQPFSNYRLEGLLGEGGSSTVYRAVYTPNGTPVAVKVLDPIQALRPTFLQRFQHEAQLLIELEHDHIVLGYEVGYEGGYHYFSMDLVDGVPVLEVIERRGYLENKEALSITLQAARALEYLHASGYLHRDIKPGNIMIAASGHARMIDLGLIGEIPEDGTAEPTSDDGSTTVGTVEYLSPEQARGRGDLDPRSDIYSLGVSLYHMVVGDVPFHGENDYEVMAKQVLSAMDTQKVKQRRITPEVHFFITKMTSKERDMRFETVHEVIEAVAGYAPDGIVPIDLGAPPTLAPVAPPVGRPAPPPVARPVAPPVAKPVAPPVARPVAPPVARPVAPPVARPLKPPVARPVKPPVARPVKPPVARPVKPPVARPVKPPVARPVKPPVAKPVKPPVAKPVKPPVAKPVKPPVAEPVKPPVAKPVKPPVAKPVRTQAPTPARTSPQAPTQEPAESSPKAAAAKDAGAGSDAKTPAKSAAPVPTRRRKHTRRGKDGDEPRARSKS